MKVDNWIETFTGKHVDPFHLTEDDIDIVDIAHSLALQCRFVGHCIVFYSVAEHCVLVADTVAKIRLSSVGTKEDANKTLLTALLHDTAEAYIGDMSRCLKHHPSLKFIVELEQQILGAVGRKFNLVGADWQLIKKADNIMLATEAEYLMATSGKEWYLSESPLRNMPVHSDQYAESQFLHMFKEYGGKP